ncbi:MAG: HAMP domain-containing sensor histidine kinase [Woeseiaceae bacterium]
MRLRRPRSLNGLILVGLGFVALPLLLAAIWALVNLDRVAEQSEQLMTTSAAAAEYSQSLDEQLGSLQRVSLQYQVLRTPDILQILQDDLATLQTQLVEMAPLISTWQFWALVPGTIVLVLIFTFLVSRPISQIDRAIKQLGESGFSKPIEIKGPRDLERLGRQQDWLRVRLLELAQEKNKFLRHMSHELKTPLANIREGTELLLDGSVGELDPAQREVTDILRSNGLRLQQLIENLLSFSAWQTKSEVLTLSDIPLRALVISVARAQRLALKAAHIQLKLEVDDIIVNADKEKIRTVIDNLLSNAVKFTPRGGEITIRATRTPTSFVLEFGDTGPGVPEDESPRIFDAFFQGRREQGGQVGGTGIGLSVVLECIQAHNGTVKLVESDDFSGAHFVIEVPQEREVSQQQMAANA